MRDKTVPRGWARPARWIVVLVSLLALTASGLLASAPPRSVCEDHIGVNASLAAAPFALFAVCGAWTMAYRSVAPRLVLWLSVCIVVAGYVWGLSITFEELVRFVARCEGLTK